MTQLAAILVLSSTIIAFSCAQLIDRIGINYGKLGNNLLSPYQSIELIKSMNASMVKLYDADPETLKLLAGLNYMFGAQLIDRIGINYGKLGNNLLSPYQSIELIKSMNASMVKLYDADPETLKLLAGLNYMFGAQLIDRIGINYGKLGNNLLSPYQSIELIKSMNASMVKLYDADPETLKLLAGSDLHVSIMVPNEEIVALAANETLANQWVHDNVFSYYPNTMIRSILVGNEVYSNHDLDQWDNLVVAMQHIRNTLHSHDIHNIKVGTPVAMDLLGSGFPPSNGTFRVDTLTTIVPLLQFLSKTGSFFFLDVYPYFPWSSDPSNIDLDFTLFRGNLTYFDPGSNLTYTNLLDQMLDSVYFAMSKLGFSNIPIFISETGWPNQGDLDQPGANVYNAAIYNKNLIQKIVANPPTGTPARPGTVIPTFIFSLYNENLKDGPKTERHWGLLNPDGTPIYPIDLTGTKTDFGPLHEPKNKLGYKGKLWCVVDKMANDTQLGPSLRTTCSHLNGTCESALGPGKHCYEPVSVVWHASYAFNAYWTKFRSSGQACYFGGLASLTTHDPSHGTCHFPSITV